MLYYLDDFFDYESKKICIKWTKRLWEIHLKKHPELINIKNTSKLIRVAVLKPSLVMVGINPDKRGEVLHCYYQELKRHQQFITFTKVVVGCQKENYYVKSVMQKSALNYLVVKEKKYPNFEEIWKNQNSYL